MTVDTYVVLLTAASPLLVVLFTWLTRRGLDRRAAEAKEENDRLAQQRADFEALIGPLQDTVDRVEKANAALRDRVEHLEDAEEKSSAQTRLVARTLRDVLRYFQTTYNDHGPELDRRVEDLLEAL